MNRDVKLLAEACASHESPGVRAAAKRILAPKRRPSLPRHSAVAKAEARKQQKKESRRERAATIREAVFRRAAESCEFCGTASKYVGALEWHHILGGGLRRHREAAETTAAICRPCHREWENGQALALHEAKRWAERNGFADALRAIEKRAAKVAEARRSGAEGDGRRDR